MIQFTTKVAFVLPLSYLLLIAPLINPQVPKTCGLLNSCDYLVSYSIFQKGTCGRAARCYWERAHIEKALEGDTSNQATYFDKIKSLLCDIPTLGAYHHVYKEPEELYDPCGRGLEPSEIKSDYLKYIEEFQYYPMPTFYMFQDDQDFKTMRSLERTERCRDEEKGCNTKLAEKREKLCDKLDLPTLQRIEQSFNLRLRNNPFYKIALIHPEILKDIDKPPKSVGNNFLIHELQGSPRARFINNCSLLQLFRKRIDDGENNDSSNGTPSFEDNYHFSALEYRMRDPWFDFYILYEADMGGHFKALPPEDRWWNETKAYQELAHYLPEDMVEHIHNAIKCVYDDVNSPEMVWNPEKFCWSSSTFTCVEGARFKKNNCGGTTFKDGINGTRHHELATPCFNCWPKNNIVPKWSENDVCSNATTTTPAPANTTMPPPG